MHFIRQIDVAAGVVTLTVIGEMTDEGLIELSEDMHGAPDVRPDFSLLVDLRQAKGSAVTSDGIRRLSERPLTLSSTSRRAVVVPSDLAFGLARMYETYRELGDGQLAGVRIFRDFAEAKRWVKGR